jgi:hypothetical protein
MTAQHLVGRLAAVGLVLSVPATARAQVVVTAAASAPGEQQVACEPGRKPCVFSDLQGSNTYTVDGDRLRRNDDGKEAYALKLSDNGVKLLLAASNKTRTQIVVALEKASMSSGAMLRGGPMMPDSIQRQFWLTLRNPKSGEEIKSIDLGMFRPSALGLTSIGDYVEVAGDELQLHRREVRIYNARSGKMEHMAPADRNANLRLFERGFQVNANYYRAEVATGDAVRKHSSPNSFSIAEFTVRRSAGLSPASVKGAIGVVGFQGASPDVREMLEAALAIKVGSAGFKVVERQRLKDLLQEAQFQNLGLTDASKAAELGRLTNAEFLLFAQLQKTGSVSSIGLRLVGVEDGTLKNGIELECRDCTPDDYLQGLTYMLQDWLEP